MDASFALSIWPHVGSDKGALWSPAPVLSGHDLYGYPRQGSCWQQAHNRFVSLPQTARNSEGALAIDLSQTVFLSQPVLTLFLPALFEW